MMGRGDLLELELLRGKLGRTSSEKEWGEVATASLVFRLLKLPIYITIV